MLNLTVAANAANDTMCVVENVSSVKSLRLMFRGEQISDLKI